MELTQVVDSFKTSKEFHDAQVIFGQDSFNIGHENGLEECHCLVTTRLPDVNLSFLDKSEDSR